MVKILYKDFSCYHKKIEIWYQIINMYIFQGTNVTWTGLLGLKQEHAAVQMIYVSGSSDVARGALPIHPDGTTSVMRIGQRMRLEQTQLEGVARKIQVRAD